MVKGYRKNEPDIRVVVADAVIYLNREGHRELRPYRLRFANSSSEET
jgi:hypothetical protein